MNAAGQTLSRSMIVDFLRWAGEDHYDAEYAVAIRADPRVHITDEFQHDGRRVRVQPCASTLAMREAILGHDPSEWLVLLTDRPDDDLGASLCSRLAWNRVRRPEPWRAVRQRYAAITIDSALTTTRHRNEIARGLLDLLGATPPPPAPGGVLTRDHALATVAQRHLHLDANVDLLSVLEWAGTRHPGQALANVAAIGGAAISAELVSWLADACGPAAPAVRGVIVGEHAGDLLAVGLAAAAVQAGITSADTARAIRAREVWVRLERWWGGPSVPRKAVAALADNAESLVGTLLLSVPLRPHALDALARADHILADSLGSELADESILLPSGLLRRLRSLAASLDGRAPQAQVEQALALVEQHHLVHEEDRLVRPLRAAVRLSRWLELPPLEATSLNETADHYARTSAWVDAGVNEAERGSEEPDIADALARVLADVRSRRRDEDRRFASALAVQGTSSPLAGCLGVEDLLDTVVRPLSRGKDNERSGVLVLVLDGLSLAVSTGLVPAILHDGAWLEVSLPGRTGRSWALSTLPSVTEASRCSLLSGRLVAGTQQAEKAQFAAWLTSVAKTTGELFHKKDLDTKNAGATVAAAVGTAIDDVEGTPIVACVLNSIDDALDRSDPGGLDWNLRTIKHLRDLLSRARSAGRTVVITSDHGHLVERRRGTMRPDPYMTSGRSRSAAGDPPTEQEVLMSGPRLLANGSAILSVDEELRYGPLKAGYHGGAAPAEVVVPVIVLVPSSVASPQGLVPPQEPAWWLHAHAGALGQEASHTAYPPPKPAKSPQKDALFALETVAPSPTTAGLADRVLASGVFAAQRSQAGRRSVTDEQVRALVTAASVAGGRLDPDTVAQCLGVPLSRLRGAVAAASQLLNVEGYAVLRVDADERTHLVDLELLAQQFEVVR